MGCFEADLANDDGWALDGSVGRPLDAARAHDAQASDAATSEGGSPSADGRVPSGVSVCKSWTKPANGMCGGAHCLQTFEELKASALPDSVCGSDVDLQTLCSLRGPDAVGMCAVTYAGDPSKIPGCAVAALKGEVSAGCLDCYVKSVDCVFERCLADCLAGSATQRCDTCRANQGCASDFFDCARLTVPPTE
jgi:hypothetical protein